MTQLSKERLEEIRDYDTCVTREESAEMARRLLAAEVQEPYGYVNKSVYESVGSCGLTNDHDAYRNSDSHIPLYAAPQVSQPVQVPDEISIFEAAIDECRGSDEIDEHAWNHGVLVVMAKFEACRAAMLTTNNLSHNNEE